MPLSNEGYIKRTPEELNKEILRKFIGAYPDYNALPADLLSNLRDTTTPCLTQFEEICANFMNGYKPDGVNGWIFEQSAESLNLKRLAEFKSQVILTFYGNAGDIIPRDTIVATEDDSIRFKTENEIIIDSTGRNSVSAISEYEGVVNKRKLTRLITGLPDNIRVTNLNTSLNKIPQESNAQLKRRFQEMLRSPRVGTLDYAYALVKSIPGVDSLRVKFNQKEKRTQGSTANEVILQNGIEAVVGGGDDRQIAYALFQAFLNPKTFISDPSDGDLDRTVSVDLTYCGSVIPIKFTRPTAIRISITANIDLEGMTLPSISASNACRDAVIEFVNSYPLGTPFNCKSLDKLIIDTLKDVLSLETFVIASINYLVVDKSVEPNRNYNMPDTKGNEYLEIQKGDTYLVCEDFSINIF